MPRVKCSFSYCDRIADIPTFGLCRGHYSQQWRGEALRPLRGSQRTLEWYLETYREVDGSSDCWLWTRGVDTTGYGHFRMGGKTYRVHRLAYELWIGPIAGDTIHHKCAARRCFNPMHLESATRRDNALEMHERRALNRRIKFLQRRVRTLEQRLQLLGVTV